MIQVTKNHAVGDFITLKNTCQMKTVDLHTVSKYRLPTVLYKKDNILRETNQNIDIKMLTLIISEYWDNDSLFPLFPNITVVMMTLI